MNDPQFKYISAEQVDDAAGKRLEAIAFPVEYKNGKGKSCQIQPEEDQKGIECFRTGGRYKDGQVVQRMETNDGSDVLSHPDGKVVGSQRKVTMEKVPHGLPEPLSHIAKLQDILGLAVPVPYE